MPLFRFLCKNEINSLSIITAQQMHHTPFHSRAFAIGVFGIITISWLKLITPNDNKDDDDNKQWRQLNMDMNDKCPYWWEEIVVDNHTPSFNDAE